MPDVSANLSAAEWRSVLALRQRNREERAGQAVPLPAIAMTKKEEMTQLMSQICEQIDMPLNQSVAPDPLGPRKPETSYILGYGRVSTDHQETSLENQRDELTKWGEEQKEPLRYVGVEAISATKYKFFERPEAVRVANQLEEGDTLVVHKIDRLGRNQLDILTTVDWLRRRGVKLVILDVLGSQMDTETPAGNIILSFQAMFAQMEAEAISERTKESVAVRRKLGLPLCGGHRTGHKRVYVTDPTHKKGRRLTHVPNDREVAQCRDMWIRHKQNGEPVSTICRDYSDRKVRNADGDLWSQPQPIRKPKPGCYTRGKIELAIEWYDQRINEELGPPEPPEDAELNCQDPEPASTDAAFPPTVPGP